MATYRKTGLIALLFQRLNVDDLISSAEYSGPKL